MPEPWGCIIMGGGKGGGANNGWPPAEWCTQTSHVPVFNAPRFSVRLLGSGQQWLRPSLPASLIPQPTPGRPYAHLAAGVADVVQALELDKAAGGGRGRLVRLQVSDTSPPGLRRGAADGAVHGERSAGGNGALLPGGSCAVRPPLMHWWDRGTRRGGVLHHAALLHHAGPPRCPPAPTRSGQWWRTAALQRTRWGCGQGTPCRPRTTRARRRRPCAAAAWRSQGGEGEGEAMRPGFELACCPLRASRLQLRAACRLLQLHTTAAAQACCGMRIPGASRRRTEVSRMPAQPVMARRPWKISACTFQDSCSGELPRPRGSKPLSAGRTASRGRRRHDQRLLPACAAPHAQAPHAQAACLLDMLPLLPCMQSAAAAAAAAATARGAATHRRPGSRPGSRAPPRCCRGTCRSEAWAAERRERDAGHAITTHTFEALRCCAALLLSSGISSCCGVLSLPAFCAASNAGQLHRCCSHQRDRAAAATPAQTPRSPQVAVGSGGHDGAVHSLCGNRGRGRAWERRRSAAEAPQRTLPHPAAAAPWARSRPLRGLHILPEGVPRACCSQRGR